MYMSWQSFQSVINLLKTRPKCTLTGVGGNACNSNVKLSTDQQFYIVNSTKGSLFCIIYVVGNDKYTVKYGFNLCDHEIQIFFFKLKFQNS